MLKNALFAFVLFALGAAGTYAVTARDACSCETCDCGDPCPCSLDAAS